MPYFGIVEIALFLDSSSEFEAVQFSITRVQPS